VRNGRLNVVAKLLLLAAVLVVPFRGLAVLGRLPGSVTSLGHLSVRSANRLRSAGLLIPRFLACESAVGTGRPRKPSGRHWDLAADAGSPPLCAATATPAGMKLAAFPLRC
jgi:hypothetical protein